MSDNIPAETITKAELSRILDSRTRDLHEQIRKLLAELKKEQLRSAIAEWAVAGLMSRNLHISIQTDSNLPAEHILAAAKYLGRNAGSEFLHKAELEFREHASYSELMYKSSSINSYRHTSASEEIQPQHWPRPFK